jgi:hypothetical protein
VKKLSSIVMLVILLSAGPVACNTAQTKNETTEAQKTDTATLGQLKVNNEIYTCEMHNDVLSNKGGKCPKCGMTLVKRNITDAQLKLIKEGTYIKPKD